MEKLIEYETGQYDFEEVENKGEVKEAASWVSGGRKANDSGQALISMEVGVSVRNWCPEGMR